MKGQIDFIYLIVYLFAAAVVIAISITVWTSLSTSPAYVNTLGNQTTNPVGYHATQATNTTMGIFANALIFIFLFACIASIIAAAFTNSSPIFAVLGLIVLPIEIIFAFVFHDIFLTLISQSVFAGVVSTYPALVTTFQYLPVISLIIAAITIIVTFIKP